MCCYEISVTVGRTKTSRVSSAPSHVLTCTHPSRFNAQTEGSRRRPSIALQTSDSILKEANERKVRELFMLLLSTAQNRKVTSSYSTMSFSKASISGDMSDGTDAISDVCGSAGDNLSHGIGRYMSRTISAISTPQREKGREMDRQTTPERTMRSFLNNSSPEKSMPLVPIVDWESRTLDLDSVPLSSLVPDISALLVQVREEKARRLVTESRTGSGPRSYESNTYSRSPDLKAMHVGYKEFSSLVTRCQQRKGPYPGKGYLTIPRRIPEAATKKQLEEEAECVFHPTIGKVSVALSLARHDRQQSTGTGREPDLEYVKAMTARAVAKRREKDKVGTQGRTRTLGEFISEDSFSNRSVEKEETEDLGPKTSSLAACPIAIRRSSSIGNILKVEEQRTASKILAARHEHLKAEKEAHPFRPTLIKPPKTVVARYKTDRDSLGMTAPPPPPEPELEPEPEFQFTARIKSVMSSESAESDYLKGASMSIRGELYSEGGSPGCEEIKTDKHPFYMQRPSSNQDTEVPRSSRGHSIGSYDSQTSSTTADTRLAGRVEVPSKMHYRQAAPVVPADSDRSSSSSTRRSTLSSSAMTMQEDLLAVLQGKVEEYDTDEVRSHNAINQLFSTDTMESKSRTSYVNRAPTHSRVGRASGLKGQERERPRNNKPEWDGNKKIVYDEDGSLPSSSSSRRDSGAKLFNSSRTVTMKSARPHSMAPAVQPRREQVANTLPTNPTREHHAHVQEERGSNTNSRWSSSLDKGRRQDSLTNKTDGYFAMAAVRGVRTRTMGDHGSFIPPPLPLEVQKRRQNGRREMY